MEEILHHLGCIEHCKSCGIYVHLPYQLVIAGFLPSTVSLHLFVAMFGTIPKKSPQNSDSKNLQKSRLLRSWAPKSQVQQLQDPHHQYHPRSDKSQFDLRHLKGRHPRAVGGFFFPPVASLCAQMRVWRFFGVWFGEFFFEVVEQIRRNRKYSEMATKCFKFHNNKGNYCHTEKFIDRQGQHDHHINIQRILIVVLSKSTSFPEFPAGKTYWISRQLCSITPSDLHTP